MKKTIVFIVFLIISLNLFSQNADYFIELGGNYNFFSVSSFHSTKQEEILPQTTGYSTITYTFEKKHSSKGKTGFFINNNFSFPVNKLLSFKTGFGFSLNNIDLKTTIGSSWNNESTNTFFIDDTSNIVVFQDSNTIFTPINYQSDFKNIANYNLFLIRIPMQLQFQLFNQKLLLSGGLSISALMQAQNTPETNAINKYTYVVNNDFENIFFNMNFEINYNIFNNIYVGARYEYSVTNVMKISTDSFSQTQSFTISENLRTYNKIHLNDISCNLSYKF